MKLLPQSRITVNLVFLFGFLFYGCATQLVATYDENILNDVYDIAKEVDLFFRILLDTPEEERNYDKFKEDYLRIETDFKFLLLRNQMREYNDETIEQIEKTMKLWTEDRENHKSDNTFIDLIAESRQEQYYETFMAIAKGEKAKDI